MASQETRSLFAVEATFRKTALACLRQHKFLTAVLDDIARCKLRKVQIRQRYIRVEPLLAQRPLVFARSQTAAAFSIL